MERVTCVVTCEETVSLGLPAAAHLTSSMVLPFSHSALTSTPRLRISATVCDFQRRGKDLPHRGALALCVLPRQEHVQHC